MVERTLFSPGGATEAKQDTTLTLLNARLDIALSTLAAALETITVNVGDFPDDYPDAAVLAKLEAVRLLLAATLTVQGTVALDAGTLIALETITALVSFPVDYPDAAVLAKVEAVRTLLAGTLAISAASLPLPAGAATEAKQDTIIAQLDGLPNMEFTQVEVNDATATALPPTPLAGRKTLKIRMLAANGSEVYVANRSNVATTGALGGDEHSAGDSSEYDCANGVLIYGISLSGLQVVCVTEIG